MRSENVPSPSSPEGPPFAPYDPPQPAPQAAAWRRAIKVIECAPPYRQQRTAKAIVPTRAWRV
jgi:hypothetical protein